MVKVYLKSYLYFLGFMLVFNLFITIFDYFDLLGYSFINILRIIFLFISVFISSALIGKNVSSRAFRYGIIYGAIISILLFIINLIFFRDFNFFKFINYLIIIISSFGGASIGINIKKSDQTSTKSHNM